LGRGNTQKGPKNQEAGSHIPLFPRRLASNLRCVLMAGVTGGQGGPPVGGPRTKEKLFLKNEKKLGRMVGGFFVGSTCLQKGAPVRKRQKNKMGKKGRGRGKGCRSFPVAGQKRRIKLFRIQGKQGEKQWGQRAQKSSFSVINGSGPDGPGQQGAFRINPRGFIKIGLWWGELVGGPCLGPLLNKTCSFPADAAEPIVRRVGGAAGFSRGTQGGSIDGIAAREKTSGRAPPGDLKKSFPPRASGFISPGF